MARGFARIAIAQALTTNKFEAAHFLESRGHAREAAAVQKAAVAGGTTLDTTWAAPIAELRPFGDAFVALTRPRTVLGRLQGMRTVPWNINFPRQTAGAATGWVGQEKPAIHSALAFEDLNFAPAKIAGEVVESLELLRMADDPAVEALILGDLVAAASQFLDEQFLDPSVSEVSDVSPASISNGGITVAASGTTAAAFTADASSLVDQMSAAGCLFQSPYWVMSPRLRLALDLMGTLIKNNMIGNWPILSTSCTAVATGDSPLAERIFLIDADQINIADGGAETEASQEATIQMDGAPDDPTTGSTVLVSTWQRSLAVVRILRYVRWASRRDQCACAYIDGCAYGS